MNLINLRKKESHYLLLLSKIIAEEVTNANVIGPTVSDVKLSNDGSHLKVYLQFLSKEKKGLIAIENAKGFIRKKLAERINSRTVPQLHFFIDEVAIHAQNIEKILQKIKEEKK
ncbi:30S ribosome-binding factor RbfA [Mesomycoplasma lagogenitalium]|uniref:Ribosome-binding factor A n=1 Tax=Mesomycoplasma lagogenitalium TaxID=171286 RepID=A0ABY8LVT0_9BACT|nr:30S ribosome-binding factor RbfA [Mesomycoplasma lagogenitalium]WGI36378.1 30S ribosome-binding factor RbfA [Mesomycoplasma lagogenitalium]